MVRATTADGQRGAAAINTEENELRTATSTQNSARSEVRSDLPCVTCESITSVLK